MSDSGINGEELFEELRMCTRNVPSNINFYDSPKYVIDNNLIEVYFDVLLQQKDIFFKIEINKNLRKITF